MALSIQRVVSDGMLATLPLSIDYFDRTEISVYFDDSPAADAAWDWVGLTDSTITFSPAVPLGVEVLIKRTTDTSAPRHVFSEGAQFNSLSLDENTTQALRAAQEMQEGSGVRDVFNDVNMHGYRLRGLADAVSPGDALTLRQYTASVDGTHADANAAIAAAASAADSAAAATAAADAAADAAAVPAAELATLLGSATGWSLISGGVARLSALAVGVGSALVGFVQTGVGLTTRTVLSVLRGQRISPEDFGATGSQVYPGDTVAVQACFNDGRPVRFERDYYVDSVTISGVGRSVDFNGYQLVGCASGSPDYLLAFTGRECVLHNVRINAAFKPYTSAMRWFSTSNGAPAQYNKIYGLHIAYCVNGLTFGQSIGTPSVDAAQSENTVYSYTTRGVRTPFVGNQSNGFITLVSPVLDCNPNEWTTQPGYDATAYQTAAVTLNNVVGSLVVLGGELLKTSSQLGYGMRGQGVLLQGVTLEFAGSQGYIMGAFTIRDNINGYQSSDSASAFVIAPGATGRLLLSNPAFARGAAVGSYSGVRFVADTTAGAGFQTIVDNGNIVEWPWPLGSKVVYRNAQVQDTAAQPSIRLSSGKSNMLVARPVDTLGYTAAGWYLHNVYGGGTTMTVAADGPAGYIASSLMLHATGEAYINHVDSTSLSTVQATAFRCRPGEFYRMAMQAKLTGGTARLCASFYDAAGVAIATQNVVAIATGTFSAVQGDFRIPALCAYFGVGVYGVTSDVQMTDVHLERLTNT